MADEVLEGAMHQHRFNRMSEQFGVHAKRPCPGGVYVFRGTVEMCGCGHALFKPDDPDLQTVECKLIVEKGPLERTAVW